MTWAALIGANALMLVFGAGLLPLLRLAFSRRDVLTQLPLAYAVGLAATAVIAAELAVVDIPAGWISLSVTAAVAVALGYRRLMPRVGERRDLVTLASGVVLFIGAGAFIIRFAALFAVKPLNNSDGWAIWGTRAKALYYFGHPVAPVFTDAPYQALQHPLLLPALEAFDARVIGSFDPTVVQAQELGFAIAFVGGAWGLMRHRVPGPLLAAILLAVITTESFYQQLPTNFADIPLAVFVALGLVSLATTRFATAALFLGAAALTKNEGELFALAAFVAAAIVVPRSQLRALTGTALAVVAIDLPWRVWIWIHHVKIAEYSLANLFSPIYLYDHRDRAWPSTRELWNQIWRESAFSYVMLVVLAGFVAGIFLRRYRLVLLGLIWFVLSFVGLVGIYWISTNPISNNLFNSSFRTIVSLVYGSALYVTVLLQREPEPAENVLIRGDR